MLPVSVFMWQWEATAGVCHAGGPVTTHPRHTSRTQSTTDLHKQIRI